MALMVMIILKKKNWVLGCSWAWYTRKGEMLNSSAATDWYAAGKVGPTVKGSVDVELVDLDGLLIKEGDYKLVKTRFSAF